MASSTMPATHCSWLSGQILQLLPSANPTPVCSSYSHRLPRRYGSSNVFRLTVPLQRGFSIHRDSSARRCRLSPHYGNVTRYPDSVAKKSASPVEVFLKKLNRTVVPGSP